MVRAVYQPSGELESCIVEEIVQGALSKIVASWSLKAEWKPRVCKEEKISTNFSIKQ
jgi:hypothetical protein